MVQKSDASCELLSRARSSLPWEHGSVATAKAGVVGVGGVV